MPPPTLRHDRVPRDQTIDLVLLDQLLIDDPTDAGGKRVLQPAHDESGGNWTGSLGVRHWTVASNGLTQGRTVGYIHGSRLLPR